MLAGIDVALLHCLRQSEKDGFSFFQESMSALLRSMARIRVRTTAGCNGLIRNSSAPEEMPTISFSAPCTLVIISTGINCRPAIRLHPTAELRSAHFRQHQVKNYQIDFFGLQQRHGLGGFAAFQNSIRRGFEDRFQQPAIDLFAIDDKDGGRIGRVMVRVLKSGIEAISRRALHLGYRRLRDRTRGCVRVLHRGDGCSRREAS